MAGQNPEPRCSTNSRGYQRPLKTTVWIECGGELISTDAAPTTREYGAPRAGGFMTTTATVPSWLTKAVLSRMLRLGDASMRLAPGRMNFEQWPTWWADLVSMSVTVRV